MEFWELGWNNPPCWICQYVLNLCEHRVDFWGFYFLVIKAISLRHVFDRIDTRWQISVLMYPWRGRLNMEAISISWYAYHQQISWERVFSRLMHPKPWYHQLPSLSCRKTISNCGTVLDQWGLLEPFGPCWVVQLNDYSIGRTGTTIPDRISDGWLNHEARSISSISLCRLNLVLEFLSDTLHRVFDSDRLKEPPDTLVFSPWELLSMEQGPLGTQRWTGDFREPQSDLQLSLKA